MMCDSSLKVTVGDDLADVELLYSPPDEPYDSAKLYISVKDWTREGGETIVELSVSDMVMIYLMLAEALGYETETRP